MLNNIKKDFERLSDLCKLKTKPTVFAILWRAFQDSGFRAVFFFRIGRWCRLKRLGLVAAFFERLMRHLSHCWISTLADIGPGFIVAHVCGIIVPPGIHMGENCTIRQNVTLGGNYGKKNEKGRTNPWLEDNVSIGPGAVILGPVTIGSNTIIGANAVVTTSVPNNSVVAGMRAEIIAMRDENGNIQHFEEKIFLSRKEIFERIHELEKHLGQRDSQK